MTKVSLVYLNDGFFFECSGHAGYAEKGKDIVCAGLSVLCIALVERISELADENLVQVRSFHCSDGELNLEVAYAEEEFCRLKVQEALETVRCGLQRLEAMYPENILLE